MNYFTVKIQWHFLLHTVAQAPERFHSPQRQTWSSLGRCSPEPPLQLWQLLLGSLSPSFADSGHFIYEESCDMWPSGSGFFHRSLWTE